MSSPSLLVTPTPAAATPAVPARPAIHPLVRLDYVIRIVGCLVTAAIAGTIVARRPSPVAWAALAFTGLLWPQLAYQLARRSRDQKAAEYRNLYVDAVQLGAWIAFARFNPWVGTALLSSVIMAFLSVGGVPLLVRTLLLMVAGAMATGLLDGFGFEPATDGTTILLCIAGILAYSAVFGISSYESARGLIRNRKLSEQQRRQLEEANVQLELARQTAERAQASAEAANQAKSLFLANMSHELRTPLNAIIGYSEMLREEAEDLDQPQLVQDLEKITGAGKHLLGLINGVLDLSKIEAGRMDLFLETFEVATVIGEVVNTSQPLVERNGNRLVASCAPDVGTMRADMTKLRQVLLNLLSNAAKFTEQGTITLRAHREVAEGREWIVIRVSDTGQGMTPEQLRRLFQVFSQVDAESARRHGGTGLGLALSRRFCRLMGGDVVVESEVGVGSTFTVRIPAAVMGEARERARHFTAEYAVSRRTALVVREADGAAALLRRACEHTGLRVVHARTADDALRLARQLHPDVVVLDALADNQLGWEVLGRLKADAELRDTPAVLTVISPQRRGLALGADEFLVKPVDRARLAAVLRHFGVDAGAPVLVVDDDDSARAWLARALEADGWTAREAASGDEALALVTRDRPAAVLLDLMMPGMDGFACLAALRRAVGASLPVVVVTAKSPREADAIALERYAERLLERDAADEEELVAALAARLGAALAGAPMLTGEAAHA